MRGRKPEVLTIRSPDMSALERIAHSDTSPWYQVRRARVILGIATGQRREDLATQFECDESTIWRTCQRYRDQGLVGLLADQRQGHSGRDLGITPVQRAQIVERISPRTVRNILSNVDLQPHRTRYWKTPRLDARFKERAEQVLWCYANAARLAERGIWVVCVDEVPTFQVLERRPIRRAIPGSIEQQEFDYTRHGTVNMLVFLVVHSGLMELAFLEANDHEHYLAELERFHRQHKELRGVFLIQDGGPSHIAVGTKTYFASSQGWWKPR